jgi:hypothetical protein
MGYIGRDYITYVTTSRTKIETDLAKKLYRIFDEQPIIGSLRKVVGAAIENLVPLINDKPTNKTITDRLVGDEHKNLAVWSQAKTAHSAVQWDPHGEGWKTKPPFKNWKNAQAALYRLWLNKNAWSASDCSDLIRLFGDLCEQNKGKAVYSDKDDTYSAHYNDNKQDFEKFKPDKYFFAVDPGKKKEKDVKAREDYLSKHKINRTRASGSDKEKLAAGTPAPHVAAGRDKIKYVKLGGPKTFWGISLYRLMPKSTVRKVDIAFGLPTGADASGTTADSILVINRVNSFIEAFKTLGVDIGIRSKGDEYILQLLPLVTMVSKGHHTLFECALTLSYHGYINYAVGFYETLMPQKFKPEEMRDAVGPIQEALRKASNNSGNKHILAYYDPVGEGYEGFEFETVAEKKALYKFASMGGDAGKKEAVERWLNKFRDEVSPVVKMNELIKIAKSGPSSVDLKPYLSKEEKHTVQSGFKYTDAQGNKYKQTGGLKFEDESGKKYVKLANKMEGAIEIRIKGNFLYGWLRPA